MNKKPRGDSRLKVLAEARQAGIVEYAASHTLEQTVGWLRADGVVTSRSALSEFVSWWELRQQLREDEGTTETVVEELKREVPGLSEEQIDVFGQRTFSLLSIRRKDLGGFVKVRSARARAQLERAKLELRERAEKRLGEGLELQREKFRRETCEMFMRWSEDRRAKEVLAGGGGNEGKIDRLYELMFGEARNE